MHKVRPIQPEEHQQAVCWKRGNGKRKSRLTGAVEVGDAHAVRVEVAASLVASTLGAVGLRARRARASALAEGRAGVGRVGSGNLGGI